MKRLNDATPADWDAAAKSAGWGAGGWVPDVVNKPAHYTHGKWEAIEVLEEFFESDPLLWQDLEKAAWYLNRKINKLKEQQNGN